MEDFFSKLPFDIAIHILSYIENTVDVIKFSLLSKWFNQLLKNDMLWKHLFSRDLEEFVAQRPHLKSLVEQPYPSVRAKYFVLFKAYQKEICDEFNWILSHIKEYNSNQHKNIGEYCSSIHNTKLGHGILFEYKIFYYQDLCSIFTLLQNRTRLEDWLYALNIYQVKNIEHYIVETHSFFLHVRNKITRIREIGLQNVPNLSQLTHLTLQCGVLRVLPERILSMTNLERLDLSWNALAHLPERMTCLSNLTSLNLSNNLFFEFPDVILSLTKLQNLTLENSLYQTKEDCPKAFKGGPQPLSIDLRRDHYVIHYNQITSLPPGISQLQSLNILRLSNLNLQTLPEEMKHLSKLKDLFLFQNQLQDIPEGLLVYPHLIIECDHNPVWAKLFRLGRERKGAQFDIRFRNRDVLQIKSEGAYLNLTHLHAKSRFATLSLYRDTREEIDIERMHSALLGEMT